MERLMAVLVADRLMAAPNPGSRHRNGYPESPSGYADPQDQAYPLDTKKRVRNAASRLSEYAKRYSPEKRAEIMRRIEEAEKRFHIGKYHDPQKAQAAPNGLAETLEILRGAFAEEGPGQGEEDTVQILARILQSEENPKTQAEEAIADSMTQDFLREVKGHDFGHG